MTWLTWRQFRAPALTVAVALAVLALALAVTGPALADVYRTDLQNFFTRFSASQVQKALFFLGVGVVYVLPGLIGAFWGAPLVARELEANTHKLVWNQGVTRHRWLAAKLGWVGGAALIAGAISLAVSWWCEPIDKAINRGQGGDAEPFNVARLSAAMFGARGIVPVGYAVLAFVIGVAAGLVLRRTVMAMAVTLVAVVAMQILVPVFVAPHLAPVTSQSVVIAKENIRGISGSGGPGGPIDGITLAVEQPGVWVRANETVKNGARVSQFPEWVKDCIPDIGSKSGAPAPSLTACYQRLESEGYRQRIEYIAADRYWSMQWKQSAILLVIALGLAGFCFWWVRRVY